jgi:hypothetical protein
MAGEAGRIIPRGERTWLVRIFMGWDFGTGEAQIRQQDDPWQLRDAQAYLSPKRDRDLGVFFEPSRMSLDGTSRCGLGCRRSLTEAHSRTTCRRRQ